MRLYLRTQTVLIYIIKCEQVFAIDEIYKNKIFPSHIHNELFSVRELCLLYTGIGTRSVDRFYLMSWTISIQNLIAIENIDLHALSTPQP